MSDMTIDQIKAVHREVGTRRLPTGEARSVLLRRTYAAPVEDVWDACTDAARIGRWLTPVTGDLRLGGTYQLEGNAGGTILLCEPPRLLRVSWVYGELAEGDISEVEVRLSPEPADPGRTVLELEHVATVGPKWGEYGPGAVGVGWDLGLLGLYAHLRGQSFGDPEAWMAGQEAREFMTRSSRAWGAAHEASGAPAAEAAEAAENTAKAYVPEQ